MASLIIQSSEPSQAAIFRKRVLVGRKPFNGVQLGQRVVSRLHAWIDQDGDLFYVADAGSRGGTFVNGEKISGKTILSDGDEIVVGPAKMIYHDGDELPAGSITFDIADDGTNPDFKNPGILMACSCGAPLWAPASMAGAFGTCGVCKSPITVPGDPPTGIRRPLTPNDSIVDMPAISGPVELGASARPFDPLDANLPQPQPALAGQTCSICQSEIQPGEATQACPSCSQNYHAECWNENHGCAAYGCAQVGAAEPTHLLGAAIAARSVMDTEPVVDEPGRTFPWDFVLLGGSVFGSILGAWTFGIPALLVGVVAAVYIFRRREEPNRVAALSACICLLGVAFGAIASSFIWFNAPPWGLR